MVEPMPNGGVFFHGCLGGAGTMEISVASDTSKTGSLEVELDRQAQEMAEKALQSLPDAVRTLKLPKVKDGILRRLREQAKVESDSQACPQGSALSPLEPSSAEALAPPAPPQPPSVPPPPPPPRIQDVQPTQFDGVEACGDEPWFADLTLRRTLRASTIAAHAKQKILVGPPVAEIGRICPDGNRVLGAGAVLRLGGAHLGGYGESDIAYAYRQLSRALHPDKNQDIPDAPSAFKRLSEAAEELRQGLVDARVALQTLGAAMGCVHTPDMFERPQEALFAEATRLLAAVLAFSGEGEVPDSAAERAVLSFASSAAFGSCNGKALLTQWYDSPELLKLLGSPAIRMAYDCSRKRFRAQFLCLLNRMVVAEAQRQNDCVRGEWQEVLAQFTELALWRDLLERLKLRVWTLDDADGDGHRETRHTWPDRPREKLKAPPKSTHKGTPKPLKEGDRSDPICWNFVTRNFCKQGDRCRYLHRFPPGYNVDKASEAISRGRPGPGLDNAVVRNAEATINSRKPEPKTSRWGSWWREAIRSVLPRGADSAVQIGDTEVRKLSVALWRDVAAWAEQTGAEDHLKLFRAEMPGPADAPREHIPGLPGAEWAFVPASDLLLTVGEGIVGVTAEGIAADSMPGYRRESFLEVLLRIGSIGSAAAPKKAMEDLGLEIADLRSRSPLLRPRSKPCGNF